MNWYKMEDICRVKKIIKPKGFMEKFIAYVTGVHETPIYQHGIRLINERGETKDVYAKNRDDIRDK